MGTQIQISSHHAADAKPELRARAIRLDLSDVSRKSHFCSMNTKTNSLLGLEDKTAGRGGTMMKPECWVACPLFSLQADTLRSDQSLLLRRVLGRILDFPTNDNIERVTSGSNGTRDQCITFN